MGNVLYSLWHLNTEFPNGSAVWGSVGGRALLEKVHHGGGGAGFEVKQTNKRNPLLPVSFLCFVLVVQDVSSQFPVPTAMPAASLFPALQTLTLWKYNPN